MKSSFIGLACLAGTLAVGGSILSSPVHAAVFHFEYTGFQFGGTLTGQFDGTDENNDGFLNLVELDSASFSFDNAGGFVVDHTGSLADLTAFRFDSSSSFIESFEYQINDGANLIVGDFGGTPGFESGFVRVDGPGFSGIESCNAPIFGGDCNVTVVEKVIPPVATPEPLSTAGLAGTALLGLLQRKRKLSQSADA